MLPQPLANSSMDAAPQEPNDPNDTGAGSHHTGASAGARHDTAPDDPNDTGTGSDHAKASAEVPQQATPATEDLHSAPGADSPHKRHDDTPARPKRYSPPMMSLPGEVLLYRLVADISCPG